MAEIEIQIEETETEGHTRLAGGAVRELLGKLAHDLISHGVDAGRADVTVGHLFEALTALDGPQMASLSMVLQGLRHIHQPKWCTFMISAPNMSPHDLLSCALHSQHETLMALLGAMKHPDTPGPVVAMAEAALRQVEANLRLIQEPFWATEAPDATDMEPAGNA